MKIKNFKSQVLIALLLTGVIGVSIVFAEAYNKPWVRTLALYLDNVLVTSTAEELNLVDGLTGDVITTTSTSTLTNKTLTSPVLNIGISGTAVLDEDNMASDSATQLATQQSIKAYVDNSGGGVSEGTDIKSTGELAALVLTSDGANGADWVTSAIVNNVTQTGTLTDNQVPVCAADGVIESTSGLTYDGSDLIATGNVTATTALIAPTLSFTTSSSATGYGLHRYATSFLGFTVDGFDRIVMSYNRFWAVTNVGLGNLAGDAGGLKEWLHVVTKDIYVSGLTYVTGGDAHKRGSEALADDAEITLTATKAGFGFVQIGDNQEYAQVSFSTDGTVILVTNSANAVNTDTDTKFCIYDGGSSVKIKNRLGSELTVRYDITYGAN